MADEKIITLKQSRARAYTEMRTIVDTAEADNDGKGRSLTAEERQTLDTARTAIADFDQRIADVESVRAAAVADATFADQLDGSAVGQGREDRALAEGAREYRDAFDTYLRDGVEALDADGRRTLALGQRSAEQRDGMVVGTGSLGGFTVPQDFSNRLFSLQIQQGAVLQTKVNVMRTSDGRDLPVPVATAHGAAAWLAEAVAATVTNETLAQVTMKAYVGHRLEKLSIQLLQDSAFDLASYLTDIFGKKIGRLQNAGFVSGNGTGQPTGMINFSGVAELETALAAGPTADEVQQFFYKLAPQYRGNAEFIMSDSAIQSISLLKSTTGTYLWRESLRDGEPDKFMGKPIYNDPDLQATGTDENVVGVFADFNNFYNVRQVRELNIVRLTERYADTLQVGYLGWQRADGNVIDVAAGAQLAVGAG